MLPVSSGATVREFYEYDIENHNQAFDFMINHLINGDKIYIELIKEIHGDLTDRLQYDKGYFKKNENMFLGTDLAETPMLISQLVDNLNYRLEYAETNEDKLTAILDTHVQFE